MPYYGALAKRLGSALQKRLEQFDSVRHLQFSFKFSMGMIHHVMKFYGLILLMILTYTHYGFAESFLCPLTLENMTSGSADIPPYKQYINLIESMALVKNTLKATDLEPILKLPDFTPITTSSLSSPVESFIYQGAINKIVGSHKDDLQNHWNEIKEEIAGIIGKLDTQSKTQRKAEKDTADIWAPIPIKKNHLPKTGLMGRTWEFTSRSGRQYLHFQNHSGYYLLDLKTQKKITLGPYSSNEDKQALLETSSGKVYFAAVNDKGL